MELEHQFTVPASIDVTWAAFNDPGRVAPCFPGATLISVYVERDHSAYRAVIEAKGKDKRGNGTANATVTAQLSAAGDATSVHVTTDLAVTGKPAQFGRGVMQDVSDKLLEQFVTCLQATLGETAPVSAPYPQPMTPDQVAQPTQVGQPAQPAHPGQPAQPVRPEGGPASVPATPAYPPSLHVAPAAEVELNLLRTIGGVLLTRYAARALGPLAFVVGYWLGRRSRR